jgi:DNA-3-methyladenine glycosylase II
LTIEPLDTARLRAALDDLAARDPDVARALPLTGYPEARVRDPGFPTLLRVVAAQQLSTLAAAAIWRKLDAVLAGEVTPARVLALDDAALRACGFSGRKVEYAKGLAGAVASGAVSLDALAGLDEEAAIGAIVALRGFGRWSAECYLLFALGRADVFPADDLGLQIGFQRLKRLPERPSGKALRALVEPWRPFRGAGAVFLWHYYGKATLDEGQ